MLKISKICSTIYSVEDMLEVKLHSKSSRLKMIHSYYQNKIASIYLLLNVLRLTIAVYFFFNYFHIYKFILRKVCMLAFFFFNFFILDIHIWVKVPYREKLKKLKNLYNITRLKPRHFWLNGIPIYIYIYIYIF